MSGTGISRYISEIARRILGRYSRPALQAFSKKYGLSLDLLDGKSISADPKFQFRQDAYRVYVSHIRRSTSEPKIIDIRIRRPHRFANSLVQLANALELAEKLNVDTIHCSDFWYLPPSLSLGKNLRIRNSYIPGDAFSRGCLDGFFYYRHTLFPIYAEEASHSRYLRPVFSQLPFVNVPPLPDLTLVIHVRSGDVFAGNGAHPGYGQPPLAFYKMVINSKQWDKVIIVYENKNNPIISKLIDFMRFQKNEMEFEEISGTLKDDLDVLLRANYLACGSGTFCEGISAISNNIKLIYTFGQKFSTWGRDLRVQHVIDLNGDYVRTVMSENWENSDSQRKLMLDYSVENLIFS